MERDEQTTPETLTRKEFLRQALLPVSAAVAVHYTSFPVIGSLLAEGRDPISYFDLRPHFRSQLKNFSSFEEYQHYVDSTLRRQFQKTVKVELVEPRDDSHRFLQDLRSNWLKDVHPQHSPATLESCITTFNLGYGCVVDQLTGDSYSGVSPIHSNLTDEQLNRIREASSVGFATVYGLANERIHLIEVL